MTLFYNWRNNMKFDSNCIFCKIADGVIPSYKIYENDDVLSSSKWFKVQGGSAHEYEYTNNGLIYNTFKKFSDKEISST